jgi:hypothetical protein
MSCGTHVGIIVSGITPSPVLAADIKRALKEISDAGPFPPLVLHRAARKGFDDVAADYAWSLGTWRIEHRGGNTDIASSCHILIVIAQGTETAPASRASAIWSLAKKARASGRTIIHIPVPAQPSKVEPSKAEHPRAWALMEGSIDRRNGTVSPKYTHFRQKHGLPDSAESLQLWRQYKRGAGIPLGPRKTAVAVLPSRTSRSTGSPRKTAKGRRVKISADPTLRPNPRGTVPLTPDNIVLFPRDQPARP